MSRYRSGVGANWRERQLCAAFVRDFLPRRAVVFPCFAEVAGAFTPGRFLCVTVLCVTVLAGAPNGNRQETARNAAILKLESP